MKYALAAVLLLGLFGCSPGHADNNDTISIGRIDLFVFIRVASLLRIASRAPAAFARPRPLDAAGEAMEKTGKAGHRPEGRVASE